MNHIILFLHFLQWCHSDVTVMSQWSHRQRQEHSDWYTLIHLLLRWTNILWWRWWSGPPGTHVVLPSWADGVVPESPLFVVHLHTLLSWHHVRLHKAPPRKVKRRVVSPLKAVPQIFAPPTDPEMVFVCVCSEGQTQHLAVLHRVVHGHQVTSQTAAVILEPAETWTQSVLSQRSAPSVRILMSVCVCVCVSSRPRL